MRSVVSSSLFCSIFKYNLCSNLCHLSGSISIKFLTISNVLRHFFFFALQATTMYYCTLNSYDLFQNFICMTDSMSFNFSFLRFVIVWWCHFGQTWIGSFFAGQLYVFEIRNALWNVINPWIFKYFIVPSMNWKFEQMA